MLLLLCLLSDVESGPEKDAKVPALKVYACTGDDKEKTLDLAGARKDKPTIYLLIAADKFDRPMNRFMKELDGKLADYEDVHAVAVWLTEDEKKTKEFLPKVQMSVKYDNTTLSAFDGKDGPKDWNVNSDAHITVIVAAKGKVSAKFGYKSINDTEVPGVEKALAKVAKKK
jgi:hypothetical protein